MLAEFPGYAIFSEPISSENDFVDVRGNCEICKGFYVVYSYRERCDAVYN